jgi:N-acetylmuramoyl-L-alanine amidase CwlA
MNIKQEFIAPNQYTRPGLPLRKVTAIAVHYAGDPGATAQNIRDYFNGTCVRQKRYASCHYAVGLGGEIIQLIPENEWAYCTCQANSYSISIETCHPDSTGKFTQASEKALVELVSSLCKKYGLNPSAGVIRHYDVTGKCCPKYYVDHAGLWPQFKTAVANCMADKPYVLPSYGTIVGYSAARSDTSGKFTVKQGGTYQFKIVSASQPSFVCGSQSFKSISQSQTGQDYFFRFQAIGKKGDSAGFYLNDVKTPVAVATII